jgi:membrane-bound metal-dependent hydrolase YbcI (DUF457 family)
MPNADTHILAGLLVGAATSALCQLSERESSPDKKLDWGELCICALAGASAALLPDILEPATSPNHRQFCHSVTAAALVAYSISGRHTDTWSTETKKLVAALGMGYLSHLMLDGGTPKSINFV